jgi:chemotaxis signal transduction protein
MIITGEIHLSPVGGVREVTKVFSVQEAQKKGPNSLNLLLFSVGGVNFGIDADQIAAITAYDGEFAGDLFWFHEELEFGKTSLVYRSPTIVTVRIGALQTYRVIIDSMEEIAEFSLNDIRPFPPLVEGFALRRGMWGILVRNGRVVLLLDFLRLFKGRG